MSCMSNAQFRSLPRLLTLAVIAFASIAVPSGVGYSATAAFTSVSQIQNQITGIQKTLAEGKSISYSSLGSSIRLAANDHPSNKCIASYTDTALPAGRCTLGSARANAKLVVAFGDSHLWQWIGALDVIARQRNWKLVTYAKASCLNMAAIFTINSNQRVPANLLNKPYSQCVVWRDAVLNEISKSKPYLIVTSGEFRSESLYEWPSRRAITVSSAMTSMMTRLKSYVGNNAARVIEILDTPYGGIGDASSASCLSINPQLTPNPTPTSAWPRGSQYCYRPWSYDYSSPTVRDAMRDGAQRSGVVVVDPSLWFCTVGSSGICPPIISNVVTYMDNAHISQSYSLLLVNLLGSSFPES